MRFCLFLYTALAGAAVVVASAAVAAEATPRQTREAVLGAKSVTIFPIVLGSDKPLPLDIQKIAPEMPKKAAELVGLFLERAGMQEIEIAEVRFTAPPEADLAKLAEAFGAFVPVAQCSHRVRVVWTVSWFARKWRQRNPTRCGRSAREGRADGPSGPRANGSRRRGEGRSDDRQPSARQPPAGTVGTGGPAAKECPRGQAGPALGQEFRGCRRRAKGKRWNDG